MIIGIDYSMTCPAACLYGETPQFWCAHSRVYTLPALSSVRVPDADVIPRADTVARACLAWIQQWTDVREIAIEDYAYSATGRVFHIGEHTGILKYHLYQAGYAVRPIPPTVIKKFATGKGNADKPRMTQAFLDAYPDARAWRTAFFPRTAATASPAKSPLADLADAYWIARYAASIHT